jgi:putative transposase
VISLAVAAAGWVGVSSPGDYAAIDFPPTPRHDQGFLYLVVIMDWFTRKVLAWRISNTLEADFCLGALNKAIHNFGPPEIMSTDQGSQFTSFNWTDRLKRARTKI